MAPVAKRKFTQLVATILYWPMRGVSRLVYGKYRDYHVDDKNNLRIGYVHCWNSIYHQDSGQTRHCRKPKNHAGDCAYW